MIAPSGIGGRAAAARVGAVDDVVVNQRCAMQKLDDGCKANRAEILAARIACGKNQEGRAHALPAPAQQILGNFRDGRKGGIALARELFFDQKEVVADQIKNLFRGQKSDGLSPKLILYAKTGGRKARWLRELKEAPKIPCCGRGGFFR